MKSSLFILFSIISIKGFSQAYVLPNEIAVFSFTTVDGKQAVLARDTSDAYLIFRYGEVDYVELEYPEKSKESWKKFTYSYYLRGGGAANAGLDLNYLYFTNGGFKYVIYSTYSAEDESESEGIKVIDLAADTLKHDYKANANSAKGTLLYFRDNEWVETSDELFD